MKLRPFTRSQFHARLYVLPILASCQTSTNFVCDYLAADALSRTVAVMPVETLSAPPAELNVSLVAMPWQSLRHPSLALGTLASVAQDRGHSVTQHYANLAWAAMLADQEVGKPDDYQKVLDDGYFIGLGDWLFAQAFHPHSMSDEYLQRAAALGFEDMLLAWRDLTPSFCDLVAEEILESEPDVVAFTTTFMQTVASLAVAARIKQAAPDIPIIFGGANCDGPMGTALHRNFGIIDYAIRGEGEHPFVELLDSLAGCDGASTPAEIGGLCWREGELSVSNPTRRGLMAGADLPVPELSPYFETLDEFDSLYEWVQPELVLETARGCWWGATHHCTFCGLNDDTIAFRARPPVQATQVIHDLVEKHGIVDVVIVDNIISSDYYTTVLPDIAAQGHDLRLFYEMKANISEPQAAALQQAGVLDVQPGIENLATGPLRLMDKGTTGAKNVQVLRDLGARGITISWNYLHGFPNEQESDYMAAIEQMPKLYHLQPPSGSTAIALERFNPYFERPELGFAHREPAAYYSEVYNLSRAELNDLAYFFTTEDMGIGNEVAQALRAAIATWREHHSESSLMYRQYADAIVIHDRRALRPPRELILDAACEVAVFRSLQMNLSGLGLAGGLGQYPADQLDAAVRMLDNADLLYHDGARMTAVAMSASVRDDAFRPAGLGQ